MNTKKVYLIGSLRNDKIRGYANDIRACGFDVFDDWHAAGERADEHWMEYERARGRTYLDALQGHTVKHAFHYDLAHLDSADIGVLIMPAGKSAHLELGYLLGQDKPGYIYMPDEPERWDMMVLFADQVFMDWPKLLVELRSHSGTANTFAKIERISMR